MREKLYLYCPPRYIPPPPQWPVAPCLNERIDVIVNSAAAILLEYQFFPEMFKQVHGSVNEYEEDISGAFKHGPFFLSVGVHVHVLARQPTNF